MEEKLHVLNQLEQEYEKYQRGHALRLTRDEQERILHLAEDLPSLWNAPSTTDEDRKVILRQIIDRVVINVEGKSEWVEIRVHWVGGRQTYRRVRRPVAGTDQLHQWDQLTERLRASKTRPLLASDRSSVTGRRVPTGERKSHHVRDCPQLALQATANAETRTASVVTLF